MIDDIKRTLKEVFGWAEHILPIGIKNASAIFGLAVISLLVFYATGVRVQLVIFYIYTIIALFVLFFFRNPVRNSSFASNEIACPADGKILSIKTEKDPDVLVIRIFLSIFNVHIQRATIDGTVGKVVYTKGSFFFANNPKAEDKNERNLIQISDGNKFAHVEQITGAIARRIEAWVKPGEAVKAGQKVGLIYFGSQVAVYLPKDKVTVTVKEGQSVQGGLTVLGLWR